MNHDCQNLESFENSIDKNKKEESSVYSDACSNSLEIHLLEQKKHIKDSQNIKEDNVEKSNIYENNDIIENIKEDLNENLQYKDYLTNDCNINYNIRNGNKKYSYQSDNNMNSNSSFSISDTSFNNRRGSGLSFSSTKSSLLSKINIKNLKKIKIDIPKNCTLNKRYLLNNNKQTLTPIDEKDIGTYNYTPSILSCEKEKNNNFEQNNIFFMRQTLDPKMKKFLFSPRIINNMNINKIMEIKNDKESENSSNSNHEKIKNTLLSNRIKKRYLFDSDNEENETNLNLEDIVINEFNIKTLSKKKTKSEIKLKASPSFHLGKNELNNKNYSFGFKKTPSLNSTLNIKKELKFDKLSEIDLNNIKYDEIDLSYLKSKLRVLPVKVHKIPNVKNRYIKTLLEIQNFFIEDSAIWVMKISHNFEYLATGSKNGAIKIFTLLGYNSEEIEFIYNKKNFINYLKLISEKPILELNKHTNDIIDLSWSPFNYNLLLSASLDHYVILWSIYNKEVNIVKKFDHNDIITSISFSPTNPNIFISGCFDRFIRIFTINDSIIYNNSEDNNIEKESNNFTIQKKNNFLNDSISTINVNKNTKNKSIKSLNNLENIKNEMPNYFNINEIITAVAFFPDGNKIAIGTHNAKVLVYTIFPKISYSYNFVCRNRLGKFSTGKKITSIDFTDKTKALITTSDSRIRYVYMIDGRILGKYKGHSNSNSMIRSGLDLCYDVIISGSENNFCYIWSLFNKENKNVKNYRYEYFKPFSRENIYCSIIVPEFCYANYIKKIYKYTTKINIISIIINATDNGRLEVLLNVEEN